MNVKHQEELPLLSVYSVPESMLSILKAFSHKTNGLSFIADPILQMKKMRLRTGNH